MISKPNLMFSSFAAVSLCELMEPLRHETLLKWEFWKSRILQKEKKNHCDNIFIY